MTARTMLAPWVPPTAYALAGGVGVCALAVSGFELFHLATVLGFADGAAVALFLGLDFGAAAGAVLRVGAPEGSSLARAGRATTWTLVSASSALNGTSVLTRPFVKADWTFVGLLPPQVAVGVAFAIAVLFPIVAALMVELVLMVRAVPVAAPRSRTAPAQAAPPRQDPAARKTGTGAPSPTPVPAAPDPAPEVPRALRPVPAPAPAATAVAVREPTKQERAEQEWKQQYRHGRAMSPAEINRAVGANGLLKGKHLEQWRGEVDAEKAANTS